MSNKYIVGGIALTCLQFAGLFYLTYFVFDWDFCEPISYLIDLGLEAYALFLFIKAKEDFS